MRALAAAEPQVGGSGASTLTHRRLRSNAGTGPGPKMRAWLQLKLWALTQQLPLPSDWGGDPPNT